MSLWDFLIIVATRYRRALSIAFTVLLVAVLLTEFLDG